MPVQLRHYKQILETYLSYVVSHSAVTDINPGSPSRTYGEAHALEAALAYVQIATLKNLFSIDKASGSDLDERAADFNVERLPPTSSLCYVTISDQAYPNPISTILYSGVVAGATVLTVPAAIINSFPASGAVVINRAGSTRELLTYTSKNTSNNTLTLSQACVNAHAAGESLYLSTAGSDRPISAGLIVKTPTPEIKFATTADVVLYDGDNMVGAPCASALQGSATAVLAGSISLFDTPPFPTASVTNPAGAVGGTDIESDAALRSRIRAQQQNLTSATPAAVKAAALKVQLSTGQRVLTANLVEPVTIGPATLYVSDGTPTFTPTTNVVSSPEYVVNFAKPGQVFANLSQWPLVNASETLLVSRARGVSENTGPGTLQDTNATWTTNQWAGWYLFDETNTFYQIASNNATTLTLTNSSVTPANAAYALFKLDSTTYANGGSFMVNGTDYLLNNTNGQLQLTNALQQYDCVVAYALANNQAYAYYTGLISEVQHVINGDPTNLTQYPGIKAVGTVIVVTSPTIVTQNIQGVIIADEGVDPTSLRTAVTDAILTYVNALGIGDDVLTSRITDAALSVQGVYDFDLQIPATNSTILDSQIAKATTTSVVVL